MGSKVLLDNRIIVESVRKRISEIRLETREASSEWAASEQLGRNFTVANKVVMLMQLRVP